MVKKCTEYLSANIQEEAREKSTKRATNGLVPSELILPADADNIPSDAENILLIPLMAEENTCVKAVAEKTIATGVGAGLGYLCGSGIGAAIGGVFCFFIGSEAALCAIKGCETSRPALLGN